MKLEAVMKPKNCDQTLFPALEKEAESSKKEGSSIAVVFVVCGLNDLKKVLHDLR